LEFIGLFPFSLWSIFILHFLCNFLYILLNFLTVKSKAWIHVLGLWEDCRCAAKMIIIYSWVYPAWKWIEQLLVLFLEFYILINSKSHGIFGFYWSQWQGPLGLKVVILFSSFIICTGDIQLVLYHTLGLHCYMFDNNFGLTQLAALNINLLLLHWHFSFQNI